MATAMWKTLGQAVHYQTHLAFQLEDDRNYELPDLVSSWLVQVGGLANQPAKFPSDSLVSSIDRRAAKTDEQLALKRDNDNRRQRFISAMNRLREYDEIMYRTVDTVCFKGQVTILPGRRLRHASEQFEEAVNAYFYSDTKRLQDWLNNAWELLALFIVSPEILSAAITSRAVSSRALSWAREKDYVRLDA